MQCWLILVIEALFPPASHCAIHPLSPQPKALRSAPLRKSFLTTRCVDSTETPRSVGRKAVVMTSFREKNPRPEPDVERSEGPSSDHIATLATPPTVKHGNIPGPASTPDSNHPSWRDLLDGFPRTTRFLASDPNKSAVIFRRFDELAIRNLLNLEDRIAALELVQKRLDDEDFQQHRSNKDILRVASSWEEFALLGTGKGAWCNKGIPYAAIKMWSEDRKIIQAAYAERERLLNSPRLSERASSPQLPINPRRESSNQAQSPSEAALPPRRKMSSEDQASTKQKAPSEQAISDERDLQPAKGTSSYEIPRDDASRGHHANDAVCGPHQMYRHSAISGQRVVISPDN